MIESAQSSVVFPSCDKFEGEHELRTRLRTVISDVSPFQITATSRVGDKARVKLDARLFARSTPPIESTNDSVNIFAAAKTSL